MVILSRFRARKVAEHNEEELVTVRPYWLKKESCSQGLYKSSLEKLGKEKEKYVLLPEMKRECFCDTEQ
jgi:hypothetical protein